MGYLTHSANITFGDRKYDVGITDLAVIVNSGQYSLYSVAGGSEYAIARYTIGAGGALTYASRALPVATTGTLAGAGPYILSVGTGGTASFWVSGIGDGVNWSYTIDSQGNIASVGALSGIAAGSPKQPLIAQAGQSVAFGSPRENGVTLYSVSGNSVNTPRQILDSTTTYLDKPSVIAGASVGGNDFFVVGSQIERGISVIADEASGPRVTASFSTLNDVALMQPTTIQSTEVNGKAFIVVGSVPQTGASGALTVFELTSDGYLYVADHLLDTRNTRFGQIHALDTVTVNDRTYLAAGGGDNGLSLFALTPDGKLLYLDSIEDTTAINLAGATDAEFFAGPDALSLYISAEADPGISQFTISGALQGVTRYGADGTDVLAGGTDGDWLFGGGGDDQISGDAGADLIFDGAGSDVLSGGAGADVFYFAYDSAADTITDFDPAMDRIDLSDWRYVNDPTELSIAPSGSGFVLTYRDETLTVNPAAGATLNVDTLRTAIFVEGGRLWTPLPDQCIWQKLDSTPVNFNPFGSVDQFEQLTIFDSEQTVGGNQQSDPPAVELMDGIFVLLLMKPLRLESAADDVEHVCTQGMTEDGLGGIPLLWHSMFGDLSAEFYDAFVFS